MLDILAYLTFFLVIALTYSMICLGLNLQWGFTGLFNVGVAGFFATEVVELVAIPPLTGRHLEAKPADEVIDDTTGRAPTDGVDSAFAQLLDAAEQADIGLTGTAQNVAVLEEHRKLLDGLVQQMPDLGAASALRHDARLLTAYADTLRSVETLKQRGYLERSLRYAALLRRGPYRAFAG